MRIEITILNRYLIEGSQNLVRRWAGGEKQKNTYFYIDPFGGQLVDARDQHMLALVAGQLLREGDKCTSHRMHG